MIFGTGTKQTSFFYETTKTQALFELLWFTMTYCAFNTNGLSVTK